VNHSHSQFDFRDSLIAFPFDGPLGEIPSKDRIGSKAHGLIRLSQSGLPVPPGFVIATEVCREFLKIGDRALDGLLPELERALQQLGEKTGQHFGDSRRPLLVSVRSGAAVSMPGMMETILNIGLNRLTAKGLVRMTGNPRLAADCRRRLVSQYGEVVQGIPAQVFDSQMEEFLGSNKVQAIDQLDTASLNRLADVFEDCFAACSGCRFPMEPLVQLEQAVRAVLNSWRGKRAASYRKMHSIPDEIGTAVIVQSMVFGNQGPHSGSGVGFTRNPSNGRNELYGDYLANAQGEDVVAGRRIAMGFEQLRSRAPEAYQSLLSARASLEREFADMQDFEFTVENGRLLFLQSRSGKRTPMAALKIACDLVGEGLITPDTALGRLKDLDLEAIQEVQLSGQTEEPVLRGTPAGSGVAVGAAVFDPDRVGILRESGMEVILVRPNAETGDIEALREAAALISAQGARTSHAAVVARQLSKPCIVGCSGLRIHADGRSALFGQATITEGSMLSVDGENGTVYRGVLEVQRHRPEALIRTVQSWREL
jgi:pyruvate, orthophosphate dikinase